MVARDKIIEAYTTLGVEEGATLEVVKTSYRQIALRTHPDKNPGNPDATAEFQRVGEAYRLLQKHLDPPEPHHGFYGDSDDEYDDLDSEFDGFDFGDDPEIFYMFMFEELFKRGASTFHMRGGPRRPRTQSETPENYNARIRRQREEQEAATERRKRDLAKMKERRERDREQERLAAEARQKAKVENKKAQAQAQRRKAEQTAKAQQERSQKLRSNVFAAARVGHADKVKKGVWEDAVDAAGGEVTRDGQAFIHAPPKDPKQTLLHIAAEKGDLELVEWLDTHNADVEERDSEGLTALHVAMSKGHIPIVTYFFEMYPPKETDSKPIYDLDRSKSLLSLAIESAEPELIWMVLDNGLASTDAISNAWSWMTSDKGLAALKKSTQGQLGLEKHDDIMKLLMRFGGFTPPPTPAMCADAIEEWQPNRPPITHSKLNKKQRPDTIGAPLEVLPTPATEEGPVPSHYPKQPNFRGRGRGRGRGQGRGRGRGIFTPQAP